MVNSLPYRRWTARAPGYQGVLADSVNEDIVLGWTIPCGTDQFRAITLGWLVSMAWRPSQSLRKGLTHTEMAARPLSYFND